MPRPAETSRVRRVAMQSIMWLILAATVGLAAFVDARMTRRGVVPLGDPQQIQNISLRLPRDWEPVVGVERMSRSATLEVREDEDELTARVIDVTIEQPSVFDLFKTRERSVQVIDGVPFGDQVVSLNVSVLTDEDAELGATYFIQRLEMARPLANGRVLTLQLSHADVHSGGHNNQATTNADIELLKKVAATLKIKQ